MHAHQAARTVRCLGWVFLGLVLSWLGCEAAALAGYSFSPLELAFENLRASPHLPIALGGLVVFYLCSQPTRQECLRMVILGAGLAGGLKLLDGIGDWFTPATYCICFGLGAASLAMLAWRAWSGSGHTRQHALLFLLPACLVVGFIPLIYFFLCLTIELRPNTYDALVYAADGTLGAQLSFALGRLFRAVPLLARISLLVYCTLPLAFMVVLVLSLRGREPSVLDLLPSFLCVAICGFLTYLIFPITGPLFAFAEAYPQMPPPVESVLTAPLVVPEVPRNCMPSLHTAWALLLWWHARPLGRWIRVAAGVFLGFTMLATLGFGAHYAFDVVVAFPSTLACRSLCLLVPASVTARRHITVLCGVGLTAAWLLLLRHGLGLLELSPILTWSAALGTIATSFALEGALYAAGSTAVDAKPVAALVS
jgi:hypothetical protein